MAIRIVRLASWLVPARLRREWLMEWEGELAAATAEPASMKPKAKSGRLTRHALGSFVDAFWIRQRDVADLRAIDDLRHGWRQIRQQGGFAFTAIAILALSMAASVVAFSVVSQILERPLPYPKDEQLITVWQRRAGAPAREEVAPANFLDWRARAQSFSHLAAGDPWSYDYTGGDRPEVWRAVNVSEGFFQAYGIAPLLGRFFRAEEHNRGNHQVVVLSARLWRSHFGADRGIVGRAIPLDGLPYVVVGVAPDDFQARMLEDLPGDVRLWAPRFIAGYEAQSRGNGYWQVVGRLKDGISIDAAQSEMDAISAQLESEHPRTNNALRAEIISIREHLVGDVRPAVRLFSAAVLAVLLIACVNVTNLLLARGAVRQHELAVRIALGANRRRVIGQLLLETLLLAMLATVIAIFLAEAAMRSLASWGPRDVLWIDSLHVDTSALLFSIALAAAVTLAAGIVPALRLSGAGLQQPGLRTMTGDAGQRRLRLGLVAVEVALALILVSGTALLLKSFVNLLGVDTGFQRTGVMVLQIFVGDRNSGPAALRLFHDRVAEKIAQLPGVESVGMVRAMPFLESNVDIRSFVRLLDQPPPALGENMTAISLNVVTPGYFHVMGLGVVRGRSIEPRDGPDAPKVVLVSEAFANRYLRGVDPVGQRMEFRHVGRLTQAVIIGVVRAVRHVRLDEAPRAEVFLPFAQHPVGSLTMVARTSVPPETLIEPAKLAIWSVDPLQAFYRTATLDDLVDRTLTTRRFALVVLTGFAALALLLAAAGLYGVLSAIVSQYRREIGVRMALGAAWTDILRLIVGRGLMVSAAGVAVGLVVVLGGARLLQSFLFSVAPTDPLAIGGAALLMLTIAAIACYIPARRAAAEDPVQALRVE
ncbi:MAG TPA: ABC transporter permease [Vicinamibacterales bacterium]|nr:ABC transporter permease [Vicinamibacterales bacterium]